MIRWDGEGDTGRKGKGNAVSVVEGQAVDLSGIKREASIEN